MSAHVSDDLPRLLFGDATREEALQAAAHLRACPDCREELVSAVVAHASLTSANRFARDVVAPDFDERVDGRVDGRIDGRIDDASDVAGADAGRDAPALPDLAAVFAQAHAEAERAPQATAGRSVRPGRRRLIAVAAAAVVVLTAGGIALDQSLQSDPASPTGRTVQLAAFDQGLTTYDPSKRSAKVVIVGRNTLKVDATTLNKLTSSQWYEVWLTDGTRSNMQPIGAIGRDNRADLTVTPTLLRHFDNIEVSVQQVDGPSQKYSGVSVLRGAYR